jgi:hypothetical protein
MTSTISDLTELFTGPADGVPDALRAAGLLPQAKAVQPVPAQALDAVAAAPVFAHIDPQRPHVDAKAGVYASFPSGLHTEFMPPELITWGTGANFSYLILYFFGLGANTAGSVTVDLKVFAPGSTSMHISATNNPVTMTLTNAATGNKRVTVQVPFKATATGFASVLMQPASTNEGFIWYGADARKA